MRKLVKRVKVILGTVGVTALSLIAGTTAWAQAAGEDNLVIEEVTVTAQKRAQSLQQVPLAISVFSSAAIEETRIRELKEFADYIPNLMISQGSERNSQVTIRGVGAALILESVSILMVYIWDNHRRSIRYCLILSGLKYCGVRRAPCLARIRWPGRSAWSPGNQIVNLVDQCPLILET